MTQSIEEPWHSRAIELFNEEVNSDDHLEFHRHVEEKLQQVGSEVHAQIEPDESDCFDYKVGQVNDLRWLNDTELLLKLDSVVVFPDRVYDHPNRQVLVEGIMRAELCPKHGPFEIALDMSEYIEDNSEVDDGLPEDGQKVIISFDSGSDTTTVCTATCVRRTNSLTDHKEVWFRTNLCRHQWIKASSEKFRGWRELEPPESGSGFRTDCIGG